MATAKKAAKTHIGLDSKQSAKLAEALNALLANYQVLYMNVRGYHWNITGPQFFELHAKFEETYNDLLTKVDELAERILTLGSQPRHAYSDYLKTADIKEHTNVTDDKGTLRGLLEGYSILLQQQREQRLRKIDVLGGVVPLDGAGEPPVREIALGDDQQARRVAIEPVHDARTAFARSPRQIGAPPDQHVHQRVVPVPRSRMNDQARRLVDDETLLNAAVDVERVSTIDGYRVWSKTYDEPRNAAFDLEEPIVREILDPLGPGVALDAVVSRRASAARIRSRVMFGRALARGPGRATPLSLPAIEVRPPLLTERRDALGGIARGEYRDESSSIPKHAVAINTHRVHRIDDDIAKHFLRHHFSFVSAANSSRASAPDLNA